MDADNTPKFHMYTTTWCGDCIRLKRELAEAGISYDETDIEENPEAATYIEQFNNGAHRIPTLVFADGSSLTEPSLAQVEERLDSLS